MYMSVVLYLCHLRELSDYVISRSFLVHGGKQRCHCLPSWPRAPIGQGGGLVGETSLSMKPEGACHPKKLVSGDVSVSYSKPTLVYGGSDQ